jgi:hypothetical protein
LTNINHHGVTADSTVLDDPVVVPPEDTGPNLWLEVKNYKGKWNKNIENPQENE